VDTRGPWFLGASPWHSAAAALYLARSAATLVAARLSRAPVLAHVNITGRGSTIRKVVLLSVARLIGLRYMLHVHDPAYADDFQQRGTFMRSAVRHLFGRAQLVIVLGQRDKSLLEQALKLAPARTIVMHNAVPDPGADNPPHRGKPECHLLFLGYLSARKGVPELLQALASKELLATKWRLTLAGGGPVDEFRQVSASLGLSGRVTFPGWLDESAARAACADADILVLPSHAEGLAMSVLEGLAHGLAVVTTPVGAHSEAIDDGVSGLLVPPGNVGALANALLRLIDDEPLRTSLQCGARRRYLEKFDIGPYAARLSHVHTVLLSGQSAAADETRPATIKQA
jgi:glycosyltransferase involved in cell wall biosynthesis